MDPIDRAIKELTEDRCGFVEDLRQVEMGVWADDEEETRPDEDETDE
jgi:hypothetical protein